MHRSDAVLTLGARARDRLDVIVDDLMERQWLEVPDYWVTDDHAFRDAVLRSTRENVELIIDLVGRPMAAPRRLCAGGVHEADVAARYGASPEALLQTYALAEHTLSEHFLDVIEAGEIDGASSSLPELRAAMRDVHGYLQAVMPLVAREHADERDRLRSTPGLRRLRLVQAAIAGDAVPELDYATAGTHMAIVAASRHAEAALAATAASLDVPLLSVRALDGRCWAWLAGADGHEMPRRLRAAGLDGGAGIGGPASFADAHARALLAERVARGRDGAIVDLRTAALEALFLADHRTAMAVALSELGPLAGAGAARNAHLRETLEVWFATRERIGEAAEQLAIAPRTVSYRLRRAEHLLGHPIAERRAELEAALRIARLCRDGADGDDRPRSRR